MYLNSVFSTLARFPPRVEPRPPAPMSPRTTLLLGDCARPDWAAINAGAPAMLTKLLRLTMSLSSSERNTQRTLHDARLAVGGCDLAELAVQLRGGAGCGKTGAG